MIQRSPSLLLHLTEKGTQLKYSMAEQQNILNIVVVWRGKYFNVKMNSNSTIKEFGHTLLTLTNVKPDTMRLLMPRSTNMGSKLLTPFSEEHSSLSLQEAEIVEVTNIL